MDDDSSMMDSRNVEIKARPKSWKSSFESALKLCGSKPEVLRQKDVYFHVPQGRLKLRVFNERHGELIRYIRPDHQGPKTSRYFIIKTDQPGRLLQVLRSSYGVRMTVTKVRHVFHLGRTRIHLDSVNRLGKFVELEVVLASSESISNAQKEAREIMKKLSIEPSDLLSHSYVDLLEQQEHRGEG